MISENNDKTEYGMIKSVADAEEQLISWVPDNRETEDFPNYIVHCLTNDPNIVGNAAEYHNLSSEFARKNLYQQAEIVALNGAHRYTHNVDLLADIVKFGSQSQDWEQCQNAYEQLRLIEYSKWSWRTFTFVIDYLFDKMDLSNQNEDALIKEIEELISKYKKLNDERAWVAEAELFLKQGKQKKAIDALKDGAKKITVAPQCCIKLADMLLEKGEYREVIKYAAIGIRGTAQDQPSASNGFLIYASALAKDALIHAEEIENSQKENPDAEKGFHNIPAVKDALLDYKIARQLLPGRNIYLSNITQREMIIKAKSELSLGDDAAREALARILMENQMKYSALTDDNKAGQ